MTGVSGVSFDDDEPIGVVLARFRKAAGLTGRRLGEMVDLSQPTISRIERGVGGPPDPDDVLRIATALGVDDETARTLMELAARSHNRMTDWRPVMLGLPSGGRDLGQQEGITQVFRVFQPAVIIGLLQTSEYARAVFSALAPFHPDLTHGSAPARSVVLEAVSARVQRQEVLADRNKRFRLVMMETVFANRICPPEEMLAQIRRVREIADQDNVDIRIVPAQAGLGLAPFHGFELVDDRMVIVDLFNTALSSFGRDDIERYRRVFEEFETRAVAEIKPILDKYQRMYAELLLPDQGR